MGIPHLLTQEMNTVYRFRPEVFRALNRLIDEVNTMAGRLQLLVGY